MSSTFIESASGGRVPGKAGVRGERGSAVVEFALVLLPFLAVVFLIMNFAWAIFAQATIQEAVREGVRVGVTATDGSGCSSVTCTVQTTVMAYSFGLIPKSSDISVSYYSPNGGSLAQVSGSGADVGGNIIQVSVTGVTIGTLSPLWLSQRSVSVGATASDIIESNPTPGSP